MPSSVSSSRPHSNGRAKAKDRRRGQTPRWFSNLAYCFKNNRFAFPVGPFLCFATSIKASSARSIGTSSLYSDSR